MSGRYVLSLPRSFAGRHTWPSWREWLVFSLQVLLVAMVEIGNDILRGNFLRPDPVRAMRDAQQVAAFEASHGFFVEPALQRFFQHSHDLFGFLLTWGDVVDFADDFYAFCHIFVTLAVVVWIYVDHRPQFTFVRNVAFLTNALALAGYELYPMAPPRLTTGLIYDGRVFHFQDTMRHVLGTGTLNGTPIGYNPFSAMPSLHVAWALIAGVTILLVARNPLLRVFGVIYPAVMLFTVVVTANHYLLDAVGAAIAACGGTLLAILIQRLGERAHPGAPSADPAYVRTGPG